MSDSVFWPFTIISCHKPQTICYINLPALPSSLTQTQQPFTNAWCRCWSTCTTLVLSYEICAVPAMSYSIIMNMSGFTFADELSFVVVRAFQKPNEALCFLIEWRTFRDNLMVCEGHCTSSAKQLPVHNVILQLVQNRAMTASNQWMEIATWFHYTNTVFLL